MSRELARTWRWALFGALLIPIGAGCNDPVLELFLLHPGPPEQYTPADIGLEFERLSVESLNGNLVTGWYVPAEDGRGTVIVCPGSKGNLDLYLPAAAIVVPRGYNLVAYNYQGFGTSEGQARLDTLVPDTEAVLDWVLGLQGAEDRRVVLFGVSLGTIPAIAVAEKRPQDIRALIVEGSFQPELMATRWASENLPLIYPIGAAYDERFAAELPDELDVTALVGQVTIPKLFVQSAQDDLTPPGGAAALFNLAAEPKEFYQTTGDHASAYLTDPYYADVLADFVKRHVER